MIAFEFLFIDLFITYLFILFIGYARQIYTDRMLEPKVTFGTPGRYTSTKSAGGNWGGWWGLRQAGIR